MAQEERWRRMALAIAPRRSRAARHPWACACIVLAMSCARSSTSRGSGASTAHPVVTSEQAAVPLRPVVQDWKAVLRTQQWEDAARLFDQEHVETELSPELRYVRARIAVELGDHERTRRLLSGLDEDLRTFAPEIREFSARAAAEVGPYAEAVAFFAERTDLDSVLLVARAFERLGQGDGAAQHLQKALSRKALRPIRAAALHRALAELLERQGTPAKALPHYRWLTFEHPEFESSDAADLAFERLSQRQLTKLERYARAERFTGHSDFDRTERELELMSAAPGPTRNHVDVLRTRAFSYYKSRKDYAEAARLFTQCAEIGSRYRAQDAFFAARAWSRAHRDGAAIVQYLAVAKQYPKSRYAEEATYLAARLQFLSGNFAKALEGYQAYRKQYERAGRSGRFGAAVQYEWALTQLALGHGEEALGALAQVRDSMDSDRLQALIEELRGVALQLADKTPEAIATWSQIAQERPLSFAALMSRERLKSVGADTPSLFSPATEAAATPEPAAAPLAIELPKKVQWLLDWGLDADAEQELRRQASEFRQHYAPRGGEALCTGYGMMTSAAAGYALAQQVVRERVLYHEPTAATRWLWDCIYPRPYADYVAELETRHAIPAGLVHGLMRQESGFRPAVVSPAGAVGLMQLMPATAERVAEELRIEYEPAALRAPPKNIEFGAYYLGKLLRTFEGNSALAAASYNAGPTAVKRWLSGGSTLSLDLWVARIPYRETRHYVSRVMGNWARYAYLSRGSEHVPTLPLKLPAPVDPHPEDY